jgi:hypothetical protein
MFALPSMSFVPVYSFGVGGLDWPWFGPLAAWTLGACLIAALLGLLRSPIHCSRTAAGGRIHGNDGPLTYGPFDPACGALRRGGFESRPKGGTRWSGSRTF